MVDKRRQPSGGRVTPSSRTTPAAPKGPPRSEHKPIVRFIAALAIAMLILTLAVGIIGALLG